MYRTRQLLAYATVSVFLVVLFLYGTTYSLYDVARMPSDDLVQPKNGEAEVHPDFSQYIALRRLTTEEFPLETTDRRIIIVGDIHGMTNPFHKLLDHLNYQQSKDVLIHVGDILTKGSHKGSQAVLDYMASHNVTGVRGNHDQKVIEWRSWIDWVSKKKEGSAWLASLEQCYYNSHPHQSPNDKEMEDLEDLESWLETCNTAEDKKWLPQIPKGWIILSDHYKLARDMSVEGYKYLLGLPLRIYIPSAHTFIVHAGLLPYNPSYDMDDKDKQPLARIPSFRAEETDHSVENLRRRQEIGILTDIPQNKKPWVVLNMRSVKGDKISRKSKAGKPWSVIWNQQMESCVGYGPGFEDVFLKSDDDEFSTNGELEEEEDESMSNATSHRKIKLPCYPSTTIYGHAAARGLDIKRWTIGLDSGCVYGERFTALVLGLRGEDNANYAKHPDRWIPYGDEGKAKIVSVKC